MDNKFSTSLIIAKILALIFFCILCIALTFTAFKVGDTLEDLDTALSQASTSIFKLNTALDTVNKPGSGTLVELDKTMLALKSTLVHVDMAVAHEDRNLTLLDSQEKELFTNLNQTALMGQDVFKQSSVVLSGTSRLLSDGSTLLGTTNEAVKGLQPLVGHLDATTVSANESVNKFNMFMASPQVKTTMAGLAQTSANVAHMTSTADQVETKAAHPYLYPSKNIFVRGWNSTSPYILPVLKIIAP